MEAVQPVDHHNMLSKEAEMVINLPTNYDMDVINERPKVNEVYHMIRNTMSYDDPSDQTLMESMKSLSHFLLDDSDIDIADLSEEIKLENMMLNAVTSYNFDLPDCNKPLVPSSSSTYIPTNLSLDDINNKSHTPYEFQDHEDITINFHDDEDLFLHEDDGILEGIIDDLTHLSRSEEICIDTHFNASNLGHQDDQQILYKAKQDQGDQLVNTKNNGILEGIIDDLTHLSRLEEICADTHFNASNLGHQDDQQILYKAKQDPGDQLVNTKNNMQCHEADRRVSDECNTRHRYIWCPSMIHANCNNSKKSGSNDNDARRYYCNKRRGQTAYMMQDSHQINRSKLSAYNASKEVGERTFVFRDGKSVRPTTHAMKRSEFWGIRSSSCSESLKQQDSTTERSIFTSTYKLQHVNGGGGGGDDDESKDDNRKRQLLDCTKNKRSRRILSNIAERRRRQRLNETLFSLRALLPNISKMDKASIIRDAIDCVRDLKKQIENMEVNIAQLEACKDNVINGCPNTTIEHKLSHDGVSTHRVNKKAEPIHWILELRVTQMEKRLFQFQIQCRKTLGVILQLSRAIESLKIDVRSGSITTINDTILNTYVIEVDDDSLVKSEDLREKMLAVIAKFGIFIWKNE